jgi:protein SCO1/2
MIRPLGSLLASLLALTLTIPASAADREFTVRGVVRGAFQDGAITIQHEAIPGFMPAMTMPFFTDEQETRGLLPGDHVEFLFRVGEQSRATRFRKLGRADEPPAPAARATSRAARLRPGDTVPAFQLLDETGAPLTAETLRGRPTVLTFIFTRCPVPEFCPLLGQKFQELQTALARTSGDRTRLLSITLDPEHDRPEVLRGYAASLGADAQRWNFATGDAAEIRALQQRFAVHAERSAAGSLDHTLATALIDPDGRVVEIWRGNAWKPAEILDRIAATRRE